MNVNSMSDMTLWKHLADVAVELLKRRDEFGEPYLVVRDTKQGREATISVSLEPARENIFGDPIPALVALGNATLNPRFVHHLNAFPIHPATVAAINKNAYREPRARG